MKPNAATKELKLKIVAFIVLKAIYRRAIDIIK